MKKLPREPGFYWMDDPVRGGLTVIEVDAGVWWEIGNEQERLFSEIDDDDRFMGPIPEPPREVRNARD